MLNEVGKFEREIRIRDAQLNDAQPILEIQRSVTSEEKYFITGLKEFNRTVEDVESWIDKLLQNDRERILVADLEGEVMAWAAFHSNDRKKLKHTGAVAMMVGEQFRNKGIGKQLIEELLEWATHHILIEKVSLGVFSTNERAIALYKSFGFKEEGRKLKEIKFAEDQYADDVLMYKFV
ncbi:GNAT family N-acetyltransferase [Halobacillus salinarum]|uniref:GNAT family N-acetyltransferase n=1 Tax=Halobacillus salinarum TaxID=2932257 RepID=A0ABY4EJK8_9BACI|nr:GNAT family N-acetyltransferase [Halobacillus salinarum]UOQ44232.1 GNAT family N-acetyltransferase [Halobacillus salinarum]